VHTTVRTIGSAQTNDGVAGGGGAGQRRPTVPAAEFTSYYNLPVINKPVWASPDIPVYLFLGGLAGAASLLGAGAQATGRSALGRVSKAGAFSAGVLSLVGLVHNLGRPSRFLNMLRVFKVTSPMNVGSWILAGYVPLAGVAATGDGGVRCRHRTSCLRTDGAPCRDDRRALLPRPWRRLRRAGNILSGIGLVGALLGRRNRVFSGYPARR
jgi:hypothetical protein